MTPILYRFRDEVADTWKDVAIKYAEAARDANARGLLPQLNEPFKSAISKPLKVDDEQIGVIRMLLDHSGFQCVVEASKPKPTDK